MTKNEEDNKQKLKEMKKSKFKLAKLYKWIRSKND